jgi:hypothetical protein
VKLFRREWIFPALMVAFVSASASATRDELSAQAAADLHCNSVSIIPASDTQFLATGCGQDRTYTCNEEGTCTLDSDGSTHVGAGGSDPADDAAAEAIAESIMELGCACASAAMTSHHSHSHASGTRKKK